MPAVKSIFIANLAETALPLVHLMKKSRGEREVFEDHALCDRFLFSEDDNRVLVTPFAVNENFLRDTSNILGFKNTTNLALNKTGESVCLSILKDQKTEKIMEEIIRKNPGLNLVSYSASPEFYELRNWFGKRGLQFASPEAPMEENRWTQDFFDSKAGFRQAAASMIAGFPRMPEGVICTNKQEIISWAGYFLEKFAGFVLKTNRGLAGAGLRIVRREEIKGTTEEKYISDILNSESFWQDYPIVVERFVRPDMSVCGGAPNIELRIKNGKVESLYSCSMRMTKEGVFLGVELGKNAVPKNLSRLMEKSGGEFGKILLEHGYRGYFEVDWVLDSKGECFPIEANLRRTGGTHVFELAHRLFGTKAFKENYFVSINIFPVKKVANYAEIKKVCQDCLFPMKSKEGVVLTIISSLSRGNVGYVVVGESRQRVAEIEKMFLEKVA